MLIAAILFVLAIVGAVALQVDDWSRDLSINHSATSIDTSDRSLRSLDLTRSVEEVREAIARFVEQSGAWDVGEFDNEGEAASEPSEVVVIPMVRTSRLFRFADDVRVILQPIESGTRVDVTSRSRVGKGDLGQNPRNIRLLLQTLHDAFVASSSAGG